MQSGYVIRIVGRVHINNTFRRIIKLLTDDSGIIKLIDICFIFRGLNEQAARRNRSADFADPGF
jgi:hypothetical protein